MDKILVRDLKIFAYHGVNPWEKADGQNFVIDITAMLDFKKARLSDDLADTVSYSKIIKKTTAVFTAEKNDLIERAAERVAQALLDEFEKIESVTVLVKKPEAPINAEFSYVAVEITKSRADE